MADRDAKRHLVDFVQDRTFDPIMRAKPNDFPEHRRDKLKDVRQSTQSEIERFRNYGHRELTDLHLPRLADSRSDFEEVTGRDGVDT